MRWRPGGVSDDIEDQRGQGFGGGGPGIRIGLGGAAVLLVLSLLTGQNFFALLGGGDGGVAPDAGPGEPAPYQSTPQEDELVQFVSFVLDDVQATWTKMLPAAGRSYRHAKLVLFTDGVRSGCGNAESAMGPFYCAVDEKVYID